MSELAPIPWPPTLTPTWTEVPGARNTDPLPRADVLVVTYTAAEGEALADVLTPGYPSSGWMPYLNGWGDLKPLVGPGGPSLESDRAGLWAVTSIGNAKAVLVKSDLHPATDGPKLPMVVLWRQMVAQVRPSLIITTGTAGGVGAYTELGDVIVTSSVRWDARTKFRSESWAQASYTSSGGSAILGSGLVQGYLNWGLAKLMPINLAKVPRPTVEPQLHAGTTVTTDFFAFDDAADHYGLRAYEPDACAVEMDDAALPLALGDDPTPWISVRNASDPQMDGPNLKSEDQEAADIYRRYGYYTTSCSAIACWAIIAGLGV
jgi:nucleoside phosphorylase